MATKKTGKTAVAKKTVERQREIQKKAGADAKRATKNAPAKKKPAQAGVSALDAHLGYWLRAVSNHVSHAFKTKVERHGVTVAEWVSYPREA